MLSRVCDERGLRIVVKMMVGAGGERRNWRIMLSLDQYLVTAEIDVVVIAGDKDRGGAGGLFCQ